MGAQNCCSKPEEKLIEVKGGQVTAEIVDIDKEGYPHDSQQERVEGSKVALEAVNQVSNQEIYNKEIQSPKEENAYEVAVAVQSPKENQNTQEEGIENEQGGEEHYGEQGINSPKPEDGNIEGEVKDEEQGEGEEHVEEQVEEVEEQIEAEEQVEEGQAEEEQVEEGQVEEGQVEEGQVEEGQVEEGQVEEGQVEEGQVEEGQRQREEVEHDEVVEEQEEGGIIKTQVPMNMVQTVDNTTYLKANNINNLGTQQTDGQQYQTVQNADELNQYFTQIGNNVSNAITYNENGATYNENGAIITTNDYDINNLQGMSTTEGVNQYFQQESATTNANYDLNNLGATSGTAYQMANENDYNQYFQQSGTNKSTTENVQYGTNYYQGIEGTTNLDYNNLTSQNTGTFDLNNLNLGETTSDGKNVDLSQYNLGGAVSQIGNEINYGISSNADYGGQPQISTSYNEYGTTQVTTTGQVQSSYVAPAQSYSYNYTFGTTTPVTSQVQF